MDYKSTSWQNDNSSIRSVQNHSENSCFYKLNSNNAITVIKNNIEWSFPFPVQLKEEGGERKRCWKRRGKSFVQNAVGKKHSQVTTSMYKSTLLYVNIRQGDDWQIQNNKLTTLPHWLQLENLYSADPGLKYEWNINISINNIDLGLYSINFLDVNNFVVL